MNYIVSQHNLVFLFIIILGILFVLDTIVYRIQFICKPKEIKYALARWMRRYFAMYAANGVRINAIAPDMKQNFLVVADVFWKIFGKGAKRYKKVQNLRKEKYSAAAPL